MLVLTASFHFFQVKSKCIILKQSKIQSNFGGNNEKNEKAEKINE